jgi:hypothetical protein
MNRNFISRAGGLVILGAGIAVRRRSGKNMKPGFPRTSGGAWPIFERLGGSHQMRRGLANNGGPEN